LSEAFSPAGLAAPVLHTLPAPRVLEVPVIVFGFNRPEYLDRVCASLLRQRDVVPDPRRVFLVQDGAVSARSGLRYAEDAAIEASVAAFRRHFPRGHVAASRANLGIAANIRRGEVLAFEAVDADCALFFEDDLELGPDYLRIMEQLRALAEADPRIGYFAAYGDHHVAPPGPYSWITMLQHHWAFGLRREPWRRLRDWLAPYYEIVDRSDYAFRDHMAIFRLMGTMEVANGFSSQDTLKTLGCHALGIARIMTDVCFGRYIGAQGASFNEESFRKLGYDRMGWVEGSENRLADGVAGAVSGILADSLGRQRHYRAAKWEGLMEERGAAWLERDRLATRQDVLDLFRLLLDRVPQEDAVERHAGIHTIRQLREILLGSREFRGRNPMPRPGE